MLKFYFNLLIVLFCAHLFCGIDGAARWENLFGNARARIGRPPGGKLIPGTNEYCSQQKQTVCRNLRLGIVNISGVFEPCNPTITFDDQARCEEAAEKHTAYLDLFGIIVKCISDDDNPGEVENA